MFTNILFEHLNKEHILINANFSSFLYLLNQLFTFFNYKKEKMRNNKISNHFIYLYKIFLFFIGLTLLFKQQSYYNLRIFQPNM